MISRISTLPTLARRFCKSVSLTESDFDSRAVRELQRVGDVLDSRLDSIGAESVDYQEGVLVIEFPKGTFVLNKHTASRQIWYSSPVSPPAYFEPVTDSGKRWWSIRLNTTLSHKLSQDISILSGQNVDLGE
jgi:frataxin-like iron-binding protein CyaY